MHESILKTASLVLAVCLLFCASARAAEINVPGDYKTIGEAMGKAAPGDTVKAGPGTYKENVTVKKGVTLSGAGPDKSVINAGGQGSAVTVENDSAVTGFTITGSGKVGVSGTSMDGGVRIDRAQATVMNNKITGNHTGVVVLHASRSLIANNEITANARYGVYSLYSKPEVRNNIIGANGVMGVYSGYSEPSVINNVIANSDTLLFSEISTVTIKNNILTGGANGVQIAETPHDQKGVTPVISYNLTWNNKASYVHTNPGEGDISADPMFTNAAKGDYTLAKGSAAVNAGDPDKQYNDPDGSRCDMGAHGGQGAFPAVASAGGAAGASGPAKGKWGGALKKAGMAEETSATGWESVKVSNVMETAKANYMLHCSACHGEKGDGKGQAADALPVPPRDHTDAQYMSSRTDAELVKVISDGGPAFDFDESMPPFKTVMTPDDMKGLVAYLRKLCKCESEK